MLSLENIPVFSLMKARMQMLGVRQKTLAENIANVSTPRYTPRDVDETSFSRFLNPPSTSLRRTHGEHMQGVLPLSSLAKIVESPDSETTLDGNSVVVEEQMSNLAHTRMEFESLIGLYRKSLSMLRMSSRNPLG